LAEDTADRIIAAVAREIAPGVLAGIMKKLRQQYADMPEYVSILIAPDDAPADEPHDVWIRGIAARQIGRAHV
jgi:hypothetical protein